MGTVLEEQWPEAPVVDRARGHRFRRPRWGRWALAGLVALVAVAVVAVDRIVFSYAPVDFGVSYGTVGEDRSLMPPGEDETRIFVFEPAAEFEVHFNITNTGDRAVEVTDLPETPQIPYFDRTAVEIGDGATENEVLAGGSSDHFVRFEPFTLRPDEFRNVRLTYRFADCELPPIEGDGRPEHFQGGHSWSTQDVEYDVFGISRSSTFELPVTLATEGTIGECDDPFPVD